MGNKLLGAADADQIAGQAYVHEVELGSLDDAFANVGAVRQQTEHDVACLEHAQPVPHRRLRHADIGARLDRLPLNDASNAPELHNERVCLHVVSAGLCGRTTSRVAGLPLAPSFPVDEAPPELSVTEFAIDADTVRARLTMTDVVTPVDLGGVLAAASAEERGLLRRCWRC